jgi:HK97 family phage prohead protease
MDEQVEDKTVIKREIGERVNVLMTLEPTATKQLADGVFETVVTTSSDDRHNENIITTGINTANYMKNPVVLYGHDYQGLPIGKSLSLTEMKNKMKAKFQLAVEEYPFAATVAALIKGGYLNAVSIGGVVRKWSEDYRTIEEMEMVEFSVVPVPANAEALITGRALEQATGKSLEVIEREFKEFAHKSMLDNISTIALSKFLRT